MNYLCVLYARRTLISPEEEFSRTSHRPAHPQEAQVSKGKSKEKVSGKPGHQNSFNSKRTGISNKRKRPYLDCARYLGLIPGNGLVSFHRKLGLRGLVEHLPSYSMVSTLWPIKAVKKQTP